MQRGGGSPAKKCIVSQKKIFKSPHVRNAGNNNNKIYLLSVESLAKTLFYITELTRHLCTMGNSVYF